MNPDGWTFARLSDEELRLIQNAERSLGVDYLMVYEPGDSGQAGTKMEQADVAPAPLDESRLECLQGLEKNLHQIVVAYKRRD